MDYVVALLGLAVVHLLAVASPGPSTVLIILWTVSIIPTYVQWHLRTLGHPWGSLPGWVMLLEYGCVAIAAAIIALRRISRSVAVQC